MNTLQHPSVAVLLRIAEEMLLTMPSLSSSHAYLSSPTNANEHHRPFTLSLLLILAAPNQQYILLKLHDTQTRDQAIEIKLGKL